MVYSDYSAAAANCGQVASMLYFEWNDLMKILSEISKTCKKKLKTFYHHISLWFVCRTQPHQLAWPEVKAATAVASTLCGATSNEGVCSQRALDEWWQWTPACGRLIQWVLNVTELMSLTFLNTFFLYSYFFLQTGMMRLSMLRSCVPFAGAKEAKCESSCDPAKKCLDAVGAMRRVLRGDG